MEGHFKLTDLEFEKQFETCAFDPSIFSHEAHLRLAWIHIRKYGVEKAIENVQTQLKNFVDFLGVEDKYNVTLTIAAVKAVYHFMLKSKAQSFDDFIEEFPRLKYNFKELLNCHYSTDIFKSDKAKLKYLEPDLIPFD